MLRFFLVSLLFVALATPACAGEAKRPITQEEMEAILRAGSTPEVLNSVALAEAYSRKYYAPDVQVRSLDEIHVEGKGVLSHEQNYHGIEEAISAGRKAVGSGDAMFRDLPAVSGEELVSFSYDQETGQAISVYQYMVEGISNRPPHLEMSLGQVCQTLAERKGEQQEIKIVMVGCQQKLVMQAGNE